MSAVIDLAEHEMNLFFTSEPQDDWSNQKDDSSNDGCGFGYSEYQKPSRNGKSRQQSKKDRRSKWDD